MAGQDLDVEIVGEGPDLVLLHSLLTDRTSYAALVERLKDRRRLILFNMPGFGTSPAADPLDGYADRIIAAFDALDLPPETDVLGNGLGGFVGHRQPPRYASRTSALFWIASGEPCARTLP